MSDDAHILVNGVPVRGFVDVEQRDEIELVRQSTIYENSRLTHVKTAATLNRRTHRQETSEEIARQVDIIRTVLRERARDWVVTNDIAADPRIPVDRTRFSVLVSTKLRAHVESRQVGRHTPHQCRWIDTPRPIVRCKNVNGRRVPIDQIPPPPPPTPEQALKTLTDSLPLPHAPAPVVAAMKGSLRAEIAGLAEAMVKIEVRRVRYLRKLARLESGHASLWDELRRRLAST